MRRLPALLLIAAVLAGCGSDSAPPAAGDAPASSKLTDLSSVLPLRAAFNEDRGSTRLLLVLSPT